MFDTPEEKAALQAAIEDAVSKAKDEAATAAAALSANNKKLLDQLREAKKNLEIDPAKHAALEDKVAELEQQLTQTQSAYKKLETDSGKQLANLTKQYESETNFTKGLLIDNGLSDALVKAGVQPAFLPAVKAMLKAQVQVVADGDNRVAKVGDKALTEYVGAWAASDEGKHFVSAPANGGGGAGGGAGAGKLTTISANDKTAIGLNLEELAKGTRGSVQLV